MKLMMIGGAVMCVNLGLAAILLFFNAQASIILAGSGIGLGFILIGIGILLELHRLIRSGVV